MNGQGTSDRLTSTRDVLTDAIFAEATRLRARLRSKQATPAEVKRLKELEVKIIRKSKCGTRWVLELQKAYGERCVYCDHAPGRTIDHRRAKTKKVEETLAWSNWCPSCGDCNRLKGSHAVVDPPGEDPRSFIVFDVVTGAPTANSNESSRRRKKGADTIGYLALDHQTLNDARRSKGERVLGILACVPGMASGRGGSS